jgi:hypothetical protein
MKTNCKYEATDEELIAIIRRIDGSGDGKLNFEEFKSICQSIILKNTDLQHVEDQGEHLAGEKEIDGNKAVPFKKNAPRPVVAPLKTGNSLDENLKVYDHYMQMSKENPEYSPLRKNNEQHEVYAQKAKDNGSSPYPRGPAMTDMTNVHSCKIAAA